jgi:acyl carrier protein
VGNKERVKQFLLNYFIEREGTEVVKFIDDIDLIDEGLLDSLDILSLATKLEDEFDLSIDLSTKEKFNQMRRIQTIVNMVLD